MEYIYRKELMGMGIDVETEKHNELAIAFMDTVIAATRRFMRTLVWERVVDGIYSAVWKSSSTSLFFVHTPDVCQLYVVDKSKFHDTLVFSFAKCGWRLQGQFEQLKDAIKGQLLAHPPHLQKSGADENMYLDYLIKSLF